MKELLAGAARVSIDPTPEMYPMPTGFGIVDAKYDSCFCRAIALKSGDAQALLITFELSDMPTVERLVEQIAEKTGVPQDSILITWTHNHTSPRDFQTTNYGRKPDAPEVAAKRQQYKAIELNAALEAAGQAVRSLRPAKVGFGTIDSYVNVNRDYKTLFGYWVEAPNYAGYSDKTLSVLKIVDAADDSLIAVLMNHGTHSTCAMEQQDTDGKTKSSGNFSGIACKFVEQRYGGSTVAMWTAGAAGNQDPILSHGLQYEYPDGFTSTLDYPPGTGYMQMEFLGRRHGADAVKCIEQIDTYQRELSISHAKTSLMLPAQKRRKTPDGKWINPRMGSRGPRDEEQNPYGQPPAIPDMDAICEPDPEHPVEMKVHLVRVGNIALLYTNGELYAELGSALKALSPFDRTVVVTYSVAPSTSYIVDRSSVHHRVFQAFGAVAPGQSDEIILQGAKKLFEQAEKEAKQ